MTELARTPLYSWHADNGARLVDFAGYSMPVQYEGVVAEHRAVRADCGLFDVSHMAEFLVSGPNAIAAVDGLITNNLSKLEDGAVLYTALCNERGHVLDDLLVYRLAENEVLIVANASNRQKVHGWLQERLPQTVELRDASDEIALIALQGPRSLDTLRAWERLKDERSRVEDLDYYRSISLQLEVQDVLLSRTGYTGERGLEIYLPSGLALDVWTGLLRAGESFGITACGLGARDTLRLEAGFSLYGHELDEGATPFESGIGWVVRLKKGEFIGREALADQKERGVPRATVGLVFDGRNIARQGAIVLSGDAEVGVVTSGTFSPTLQHGIALARVQTSAIESSLEVDIRGRRATATIQSPPFVPNRTRE